MHIIHVYQMKYLIIDTTTMYLSNICIHVHLVINVPTKIQNKVITVISKVKVKVAPILFISQDAKTM